MPSLYSAAGPYGTGTTGSYCYLVFLQLQDLVGLYRPLRGTNTHLDKLGCIIAVAHIAPTPTSDSEPPAAFIPLQTAGYVLPLCTNAIATAIILYGIRRTAPSHDSPTSIIPQTQHLSRAIMVMVVESGALYLVVQLVLVVLTALDHPAQNIIGVMAVQIYVRRGHLRSKRDANILADHPSRY